MDCLSCRNNDQIEALPPRERVAADEYWRVSHAFNSALPGWLIVVPRRHVKAIADLTDAEAAALGPWQVRLSRALHAVTGCQKTYLVQFAEQAGFEHVHFHLVPRMPGLPDTHRGRNVFQYLIPAPGRGISEGERDGVALALTQWMGFQPSEPAR